MRDIVKFFFHIAIIVKYFVPGQHGVFVIVTVRGECAVLIWQKLLFGVCNFCYCQLIYDDSVIALCIIINNYRTFLFSQIPNLFICGIFEPNCFVADKEIYILKLLITNNKYTNQVSVIKQSNHRKMGLDQGLSDHCEGDREFD